MPLSKVRVSLSNSFYLKETAVIRVFEVAEFKSVVKVEVAPFLVVLGPVFARNLGITLKWWVVQARRSLLRVSSQILHNDKTHRGKFWKHPNCKKCSYYMVEACFRSIYREFIRFEGNNCHRGFQSLWIRICRQNWSHTLFGFSRYHFCTKFWNNSRTVGHRLGDTQWSELKKRCILFV